MKRRSFLQSLGGAAAMPLLAAEPKQKTRYYILQQYFLRNSTQMGRIQEFFGQGWLPAAASHTGPKIFLEALVAPHMPQVASIVGYESLDQYAALRQKMHTDADYQKAFAKWEAGPEPPYEHYSETVLKATDYSPEVTARTGPPRVFELRTYHSPTWRQLGALHQRFAGPEIRIFHRAGVHPILYTETVTGANLPNLTYVIPFDNLAAREKAWDAFGADAEWVKVRKESVDAHGQISSVIQISLWRPAAYSPVK